MAIASGTRSTLIDHVLPEQSTRSGQLVRDVILIVAGSILMALSAKAQIVLPGIPVSITLQTLVVMLIGASYGSKRGALTILLYLAEGAAGLPIFSRGAGWFYLIVSPSAGYLWAMPIAAFAVGWLCERGLDRSYLTSIFAMIPSSIIILTTGTLWMAIATPILNQVPFNLWWAFSVGWLPFIPGDIIKLCTAAALLPTVWYIVKRIQGRDQR